MPLPQKYKLTENLWQHVGPKSRVIIRVGLDAQISEIVNIIHCHIDTVVTEYRIPETLERRFNWLSAGDVEVKQNLLNHVRQLEKSLVVEGAQKQLPVMLMHLRTSEGQLTHRLAHVLKMGNHEIEVTIDRTASGVRLEQPSAVSRKPAVNTSAGNGLAWIWWLLIAAGILLPFLIE